MKKILITGSLGYLGSVLTRSLTERGFDCVGFDTGFFRNSLLYPAYPTNTVLRDAREITEADLKQIDVVVHLAGISNDPVGKLDPSRVYDPTRVYAFEIAKIAQPQF